MQEPASQQPSKAMAFATGFGVAALLTLALLAALSLLWVKERAASRKKGWNLVDVLAVTRDLEEGAVLTAADVAVRPFPEQFATASVYRPGEASRVIGTPLQAPVLAGDALRRSNFEKPLLGPQCAEGARAAAKTLGLDGSADVKRFLDALAASSAAKRPAPPRSAP